MKSFVMKNPGGAWRKSTTTFLLSGLALVSQVGMAADKYCDWEIKNYSIDKPLCGLKGDPKNGRKLAIDRKKGNCLACHAMPIPEQDFHGNIAPPLNGVGARYKEGDLRARLVDIKQINPMSLMPSFYKHPDKLVKVAKKFKGKTVLTAQEIEDIVAYLKTLQK
jgi:sulfur-oxidizing protein SoxX